MTARCVRLRLCLRGDSAWALYALNFIAGKTLRRLFVDVNRKFEKNQNKRWLFVSGKCVVETSPPQTPRPVIEPITKYRFEDVQGNGLVCPFEWCAGWHCCQAVGWVEGLKPPQGRPLPLLVGLYGQRRVLLRCPSRPR